MSRISRHRFHHFPCILKCTFPNLRTSKGYMWMAACGYLLLLLLLFFGPIFRARRFECVTNTKEACPDFVIPELKKYANELVFMIDEYYVANKIRNNIPQSEKVTVISRWPDTLVCEITWQAGFANLGIPASNSAFLVAKNGQIIKWLSVPDQNLPIIIASSAADLIISDTLTDSSLVAAFEILKAAHEYNIVASHVDVISPQDIRVILDNNKIAVFTSLTSIQNQVLRLQLIQSQTTINSELPIIDVRYDRPALKQSF